MSHPSQVSRRLFLQQAAAIGTLGAAAPVALNLAAFGPAAAAGATDYKALVCVFLTGGNDAYNTVLATDTAKLGLIFLDVQRAAKDVGRLIGG